MIDFRKKIMGRLANNLFQFAYIYTEARENRIPNIYVQSEKYFEKYKDEIKLILHEGIGKIDMVAIHVRRGDYVDNPFYVDLSETPYYEEAMAQFPDAEFIVFSDDIEWCKQQEMFRKCEFSEGKTEEEDLNLMASCTGHIIANSSFSWWGAWLSPHGGKVIAPKAWHPDGIIRTELPNHWIQI